ncbi:MAG: CPBP family intramembrane metalloprotease [Bacteroidaceae bacterium]|nr:CPBP family intramembrane metalloprotease [Bacteroidaceae bacterium]
MKRTIKLVIYYFLYQFLFTFLVMAGALVVGIVKNGAEATLQGFDPTAFSTDTQLMALGLIFAGLMMLWHLIHFHYISIPEQVTAFFRKKKSWLVVLLCIPFVYTVMYLLNQLSAAVNLPDMLEDTFMDMSSNVWGILSIALVAPILEECLFRGAIEGHLLTKMKPWAAILVSAAVFGIIHMNPAQVFYAFLVGIVLGWLYWRSGSIVPSTVAHILNNSLSVVFMNIYGTESGQSFEEALGEQAQPYIWALYALIAVVIFFELRKIFMSDCNLSDSRNV